MVTRNRPEPNDSPERDVEARIQALMIEFESHFRDFASLHPEAASRREHVFQAWVIQKIGGLQVAVEQIAQEFNLHVRSAKP